MTNITVGPGTTDAGESVYNQKWILTLDRLLRNCQERTVTQSKNANTLILA